MLVTTTPTIEGGRITRYYGIVSGETIIGLQCIPRFLCQHPRRGGWAKWLL